MEAVGMFEYDRALPLGREESSSVMKESCTVRDISYNSPHGGKVPAYLVVPSTDGPFPAVVFMHPGQGNRRTFLSEAEHLASKGVISLLIDAPFVHGEVPIDVSEERVAEGLVDIRQYTQTVVDLQRGIDLLTRFENVDVHRIGYVGHSYGATWGGVLAGVEERVKTYVLMAGFSRVSKWHRTSDHPLAGLVRRYISRERLNHFLSALEPMDAVHYIKHAAPASLFFQFAYDDEFISKDQADTFYTEASSPKEVAWYDTDHLFSKCDAAYRDRTQWIIEQLGVEGLE
jgi:dienelactone hydrolase